MARVAKLCSALLSGLLAILALPLKCVAGVIAYEMPTEEDARRMRRRNDEEFYYDQERKG